MGQLSKRGQRADAQSLCVRGNATEIRNVFDVDLSFRCQDIVFHQCQQIGTAREDFGVSPGCAQQADGLGSAVRADVFKRSHHAPPFFSIAARTRSGVSGRNGTRTPMALATALEIAAPGEITGGSPNPMTPRSSYPLPVIMWTTSSGISLKPARR